MDLPPLLGRVHTVFSQLTPLLQQNNLLALQPCAAWDYAHPFFPPLSAFTHQCQASTWRPFSITCWAVWLYEPTDCRLSKETCKQHVHGEVAVKREGLSLPLLPDASPELWDQITIYFAVHPCLQFSFSMTCFLYSLLRYTDTFEFTPLYLPPHNLILVFSATSSKFWAFPSTFLLLLVSSTLSASGTFKKEPMNMLQAHFITKIIKASMGPVFIPSSMLCLTFCSQFFTWFPAHTSVEINPNFPKLMLWGSFIKHTDFLTFPGSELTLHATKKISLRLVCWIAGPPSLDICW